MKRPLNPTSRRKRPCRMPRIAAAILLTALTAIAAPKARADEGMWLPSLIGELIDRGELSVSVLRSSARWFGMTYHEDRARVAQALSKLHETGVYPEELR